MDSNPDVEVQNHWLAQPRPAQTVPLDDIRTRAERLERTTRRWRAVTGVLLILLLIKGALEVWTQPETLERAGDLLLMAALLYVAYRYRRWRQAAPPAALGRTNCVEFYRAELVRQRDLSQASWGFLLPFVPGLTLALLDGVLEARQASHEIVLVLLGVALFVGVALWNAYTTRRLQTEIDSLDSP
jgi:hypothetical protein